MIDKSVFFGEIKKKIQSKIYMESQGSMNCQNDFEKGQHWRTHSFWFKNLL